jgi:hypothetical protein
MPWAHVMGRLGLIALLVSAPLASVADTSVERALHASTQPVRHVLVAHGHVVVLSGLNGSEWVEVDGAPPRSLQTFGAGNLRHTLSTGPYAMWRNVVLDARTGAMWRAMLPGEARVGWDGRVFGIEEGRPWSYDLATNRSVGMRFGAGERPAGAPDVSRIHAAGPAGIVVGTDTAYHAWGYDGSWRPLLVGTRTGGCDGWIAARFDKTWEVALEQTRADSWTIPLAGVPSHVHSDGEAWVVVAQDPASLATTVVTGDCSGAHRRLDAHAQGAWVAGPAVILWQESGLVQVDQARKAWAWPLVALGAVALAAAAYARFRKTA